MESGGQTFDPRKSVESVVEAEDAADAVTFHHGDMDRITSRQLLTAQHDRLGTLDGLEVDRQDVIDHTENRIERRLDRGTSIDRDIPVKDFLEHLGIRHKTLALRDEPLQGSLGVNLVRVRGADQVHRHVGIDKNHGVDRPA